MQKTISSFKFALVGVTDALIHQSNFRLQWLCGVVVLLSINLLDIALWQEILLFFLVFLILSLELLNCALEMACDSTGTSPNHHKKLAKDFAAGAVLLMSFGAAVIYASFCWLHFDTILNEWLGWVSLTTIFALSLPAVLSINPNKKALLLFFIALVLNGMYSVGYYEKPSYLMLAALFHLILAAVVLMRAGFLVTNE